MSYRIAPLNEEVVDGGERIRAVFLHGYACSAADWIPVAGELGGVASILIDFPGHGSSASTASVAFDELVDATARYISALEHPPVLIGHSMGGMVAIKVAATSPQLITGLILVDAFPHLPAVTDVFGGAEDPDDPFGYGSVIDRQTPPEIQERVREEMATGVSTAGPELHAQLMALDLRALLPAIEVRTLVIVGDRHGHPDLGPTEVTESLGFSGLPAATVVLLPSHHFVMLEQPSMVARQIEKYLLDQEVTPKGMK